MKNKLAFKIIKILVAILVFALLFYMTDTKELMAALAHLDFASICWLMSISFLLVYLSALKWSLFLTSQGNQVSVVRLFLYYLLGYFVNLVFPSYVGGDVVRSLYAGGHGNKTKAFVATILERYTGFIAMLAMAVTFIWFTSAVTIQMKLLVVAMTLNLVFMTWLAVTPRMSGWLLKLRVPERFVKKWESFRDSLTYIKGHPTLFMQALGLSFAFHIVAVVNVVAAGHAVGWIDIPITELFIVLPVILLIGAIPISPNGLGIQEGAYVYFLTGLGATPAQAFGLALVLRAKVYILALLGGLVWLFLNRSVKQDSSANQNI
jgi:uncharacterized protein (TIRG00374 family)